MTSSVSADQQTLDAASTKFLMQLVDTPGPSGFEGAVAEVWKTYAGEFAEVHDDSIGNTYATVNPGGSPTVMITGHLDEIGLIITKIDDKGFIRCVNIGGWDIGVLIGQRVRIMSAGGIVHGCIGRGAIHQLDPDERRKMPKLKDLWIDIGAADGDDARARVSIGDPIVLDASPRMLSEHRIMSRSLDDRLGAFISLEVGRQLGDVSAEVIVLGASHEETGGAGAITGAFSAAPDLAIAIDVTATSDTPAGLDGHTLVVGKGPIITRGASSSAHLADQLVKIAEANSIPYQLRGLGTRTSTDADSIIRAGKGVPVALISIPTRYLHTPCEIADLRDVRASIDLIVAWVQSLGDA